MTIRRKIGKWISTIILVAALPGIWFLHYSLSPISKSLDRQTVIIPKGSGFPQIAEILAEAGLVKNRPFFRTLTMARGASRRLQAGEYEFAGRLSPNDLISRLVNGEIKQYEVMLPEDITVDEVANRLAAFNLINVDEFMALSIDKAFLQSLKIEAESIEGYLFPNTYFLNRSMTTREIIHQLVGEFWRQITPEIAQRVQSLGFTIHQWVTFASLIGKESGRNNEKGLISAVFHNRLKQGMRLQSDPTAVYRLEENGAPVRTILRRHLAMKTPHNTYQIYGLPPGPIANPGLDSLRAALYPEPVPYLYFVASPDGGHQFSSTLTEHNQAVSKYRACQKN
ncbi:MAG: endolytic transglycosylase MltG [Syntrophaceae bacterium]|nr:endolytic transglycosylase MltG [Syntrophaceae bacterium]